MWRKDMKICARKWYLNPQDVMCSNLSEVTCDFWNNVCILKKTSVFDETTRTKQHVTFLKSFLDIFLKMCAILCYCLILRWSFKMFGPLKLHWHWDLTFCSASMPPALFQSVRFFGPSWMGFDICRSWILLWPGQHEGERHFWSGHGIDDNASVSGMVTSDISHIQNKKQTSYARFFW